MKTVLLAGGLGTRMREETEYKPKPMVEIGGRPVLWHLMRMFAQHGLSDFVRFHRAHGRLATITTIRPLSRFGIMELGDGDLVQRFREKPQSDDYVNAGFFVFEPTVLNYLDDECVLEREPLEALAKDGE